MRASKPVAAVLFLAILVVAGTIAYIWVTRSRPDVVSSEDQAVAAKSDEQVISRDEPITLVVSDRGAEKAPPPRPIVTYYYPVTVGTKWVYQVRMFDEPDEDRTLVVTAVEGKGIEKIVTVGRIDSDRKVSPWEKVRVRDQQLDRLEDQGTLDPDPMRILEDPERVSENKERLTFDIKARKPFRFLSGPSKLTVPAGTFKAIKMDVSADGEIGDLKVHYSEQSWYARDVGLIKRTVGPTEIILKAFTLGKE